MTARSKSPLWDEQVEAARLAVGQAEKGNVLAARRVLKQAAVALRDVLPSAFSGSRHLPDPERCEYVRYLLVAIEQILEGVEASKALGLWSASRPHRVDHLNRDLVVFMQVGIEYSKLSAGGKGSASVKRAIEIAAKRLNVGTETARKIWNASGGLKTWKAAAHWN